MQMRYSMTTSLVLLGATATYACAGPTDADGSIVAPAGDAGSSAVQELVEAYCDGVRSCCQKSNFPLDPLTDCETQFKSQVNTFRFVDKGTVTVSSGPLATCLQAFRSAISTCNAAEQSDPSCQGVFAGTIAPGGSCEKL